MLDDPESKRGPVTVQDLAKETAGKKKVSAKDYLSRKRSPSPSPADRDAAGRTESRLHNGTDAKRDRAASQASEKPKTEHREKEKTSDSLRSERIRSDLDNDRPKNLLNKPEPVAHSSASKKRTADESDHVPPTKRTKPDLSTPRDTIRAAKPETPRPRDQAPEKSAQRDSKANKLYPTANGRPHKELDREREYTASPKSTIQVNGTKSHATPPRRGESSKVPALLSPLHPSLDREIDDHERTKKRPSDKAPPRRTEMAPVKKPRSRLPELLSPTLPPLVEAELVRLKMTPTQGDSSQRSTDAYDSPNSGKKSRFVEDEEPPARPSRIVTLKLRKGAAKRAKDLLSLPSKSLKEALKKERSISVEGTPPPARKRPRMAEDLLVDGSSARRSKAATEALKSVATPNTPLKHTATSMSRVTSSQSQVATPSNSQGLTPGTAERPPTSSDNHHPVDFSKIRVKVEGLRERHDEFRILGGRLKHARDDLIRDRGSNIAAADQKRAAALHFEMILSYMVSFNAFNQSRVLERKVSDLNFWESLLPHIRELKQRVRHSNALLALAHQMHAVCLEEISHAYATLDPTSAASSLQKWSQLERMRRPTWEEAMRRCDDVESRTMKVVVGPWTNVDDAVASALSIMCRWAERDQVDWRPSGRMSNLKDAPRERTERVKTANGASRS